MRDHQEINAYEPFSWSERTYICPKHGNVAHWGTEYTSSSTVTFPVLLKGRDDSKIGPSPYPTAYWAYRMQYAKQVGNNSYLQTRARYFSGHGYVNRLISSNNIDLVSRGVRTGPAFTYFVDDGKPGYKPNVSAETEGRAIKNANAKLRSDSINIGQSVGEMPEAIQEFAKTTRFLLETIIALKRGNLKKAKKALGALMSKRGVAEVAKASSNTYLFYQFGVVPLLNDLNHMAEEIGKAMDRPDFLSVQGRATDQASLPSHWAFTSEGSLTEICEVGYNVRPKPQYSAAFLGLTNPIATLWELVPLSFVANWFVSIGDVLNALDAGVGLDFVSGYKTTVVKGESKMLYNEQSGWTTQGSYSTTHFAMEREVLTRPDVPPLHLKTGGLGTGQLTSLAAILMQFVDPRNLAPVSRADFRRRGRGL